MYESYVIFGVNYSSYNLNEYGLFIPLYKKATIPELKEDSKKYFSDEEWTKFVNEGYHSPTPEQHLFLVETKINPKSKNVFTHLTGHPYIITTKYAIMQATFGGERCLLDIYLFSNRIECKKFYNDVKNKENSDTSLINFLYIKNSIYKGFDIIYQNKQ